VRPAGQQASGIQGHHLGIRRGYVVNNYFVRIYIYRVPVITELHQILSGYLVVTRTGLFLYPVGSVFEYRERCYCRVVFPPQALQVVAYQRDLEDKTGTGDVYASA
jgi:hypothetical protein